MTILITTMAISRAKKILGTFISLHFVKINFLLELLTQAGKAEKAGFTKLG